MRIISADIYFFAKKPETVTVNVYKIDAVRFLYAIIETTWNYLSKAVPKL